MSSVDQIQKTCDLLFSPGQVIEIRAFRKRGIASGYFTDFAKLAEKAEMLEHDPDYSGIYITLNEINPDLLARRANRIELRLGEKEKTTADADIIRRRWLPIDIDPKRLSGISSSDPEHELALEKAEKIRSFLSDMGWPDPIIADSGNGAHLLYRIDLPNDETSLSLVKNCLSVLSTFFSDEESDIDTAVSNAARIWKLYGTITRKGDSTQKRPHRRSGIRFIPDQISVVPLSFLTTLSSFSSLLSASSDDRNTTTQLKGKKRSSVTDLGDWLHTYGLSYTEKSFFGGRLFILDECPFSSDHKDGAYAIQFASGGIFAGCHHTSCGGGTQRWRELRDRFEGHTRQDPEARLRQFARDRAEAKARLHGIIRKDSTTFDTQENDLDNTHSDEIILEASQVLRDGNPEEYLLTSFATDHEGDEIVAKCLIMSLASRAVINSNGLHVLVTGESGKGKTHAFDTMLQHIPPEFRLDGRMSDKALFYADDLRPGSAICLDDVTLSDQMQEILKGVTSAFQRGFVYRTVDKERKGQKRHIPARCLWWVAKVEGTGDDQVWNRMLTCWIDDSEEQDDKVLERELVSAETLPSDLPDTRREVLVCQQIWKQMTPVHVVIPYATRLRFLSSANRRNPGMLLDLIKSVAALHQFQRERTTHAGVDVIYATRDDFFYANQIYQALNEGSGAQDTKLTRNESDLLATIRTGEQEEISIIDMQALTGRSYSQIHKMIHGYRSHGNHYTGLLEKCPALSFLDRTDVSDGGQTSRRVRVYLWNENVYQTWASGGLCWLIDDPNDKHDGNGPQDGNGGSMRKGAEMFRNENSAQKELNCVYTQYTSNNFLENESLRKNEDSQEGGDSALLSSGDPGVSAPTVSVMQSGVYQGQNLQSEEENSLQHLPHSSATGGIFPPTKIDPDRFCQVWEVWQGSCSVCGKNGIMYRETLTNRMKQAGYKPRNLCQRCYSRAVARKSQVITTLPGLLNIPAMVRAEKDYGRCTVCNRGTVAWYDPETKTGICETCYAREKARSGGIC